MEFNRNGEPVFADHEDEIYDYEKEEAEVDQKKASLPALIALTVGASVLTLAAASASVWIGLDLIAGYDVSFREAVGGGWLVTAIGGYAGARAKLS